ncbi:MAG: hypothetical protein HKP52_01120 [Desulfofustis sp.]|nr:hypothetical protein [Desulfofustis sp.]
MKGTLGSIGCKTLETLVGLEEHVVHPLINSAAYMTRIMGASPLETANFVLDMTKYTIAAPQLFWGVTNPLGVSAINMFNPKRQIDYLLHATRHIEPMRPSLPHHVEWEDERATLLSCDTDNGISDNPVTIFVAYTGRSATLADYNSKFNPDQRSSLAREFLDNGFGPVNIFVAKKSSGKESRTCNSRVPLKRAWGQPTHDQNHRQGPSHRWTLPDGLFQRLEPGGQSL